MVTFDRHPATVVRPESAPCLLCDLDQKLELLESAGVDRTVVVPFDEERANETAEDFVDQILVEGLDARLVVVGEDFHFGHGRKGNVALLREMGAAAGFDVDGVSLRADRQARPARGAHLLDPDPQAWSAPAGWRRPPSCWADPTRSGARWSHGDQRGGPELGFPTANVDVPDRHLPAGGRHLRRLVRAAGRVAPAGRRLGGPAARPSTGRDGRLLVEAFLLDFSGDLYGEEARVSFVAHLRDEVAFDSRG